MRSEILQFGGGVDALEDVVEFHSEHDLALHF